MITGVIRNIAWITPFVSFISGYILLDNMYHIQEIETPQLVGQRIVKGFEILSRYNLTPRILATKINLDIPEGTILSQTPAVGKKIKEKQSVFLVISTRPEQQVAPNFLLQEYDVIAKQSALLGIRNKYYYLPSSAPHGTCIAQLPPPGIIMDHNLLITYLSTGNSKPILWPNLKNKSVAEVLEFLEIHNLKADIIHSQIQDKNHNCSECFVYDQRPLAGSIISLNPDKPICIQLKTGSNLVQ